MSISICAGEGTLKVIDGSSFFHVIDLQDTFSWLVYDHGASLDLRQYRDISRSADFVLSQMKHLEYPVSHEYENPPGLSAVGRQGPSQVLSTVHHGVK